MRVSRNDRAPRGAAKHALRASWREAESSGIVDLAALMAKDPNGLEGALARVKASGRASQLFDEGAVLAPVDLNAWACAARRDQSPRPPPRRVRPVFFVVAALAALVLACALAPRGYRALVANTVAAPSETVLPVSLPAALAPTVPPAPTPVPTVAQAPASNELDSLDTPPSAPAEEDREASTRRGRSPGRVGKAARTRASRAVGAHRAVAAPAAPSAPTGPAPKSALASALRDVASAPAVKEPAADAPAPPPPSVAPATTGRDTVPERPSGSAVASAITQVLPAARACLGDVPEPSRATITFGPDGAVQKVDVTGPAAMSPKQAPCIRNALGRAHVPPFSQGTYTASVTVRPR